MPVNNTENDEEVVNQDNEPEVTPDNSRDGQRDAALEEGTENAVIDSLADKSEITIDDLRQLPGADKMSDAELQAAWDKAQAEAGGKSQADGSTNADTKVELPFPVYDAQGNKIAPDKVTLGDLLSGKALVGYNAMGKEQRKALQDVVRNASQGHWNEHRYNTVNQQYRQAHERATKAEGQVKEFETQRQQWNAALTALVTGNNAPMKALVEAYQKELTKTGITPQGYVAETDVNAQREAEARGYQWYTDVGVPAANEIATNYGADFKEVMGAIKYFIEQEPNITPARIDEILKYDVPMAFEQNGYTAKGQANTQSQAPANDDVASLKKQIEALSAKVAGNANASTDAVRKKVSKIPSAGSGSTPGAGDSMPSFKSRNEMKSWFADN